ncbi:hypothetical protein [Streptomyces fuscichromogenes]|uniref:Uncharacterized protein n=1 Tax=Streptomyces fuscichromogenes TaxID=1324013 RepID=A0A918CWP7_9ACTN|nr:hypothetical protein [Streptomyces fuscichromogenes]GGN41128.1 hypothetical protein GCM10011578_089070 [Streptomyces fuscichromogenes]
MPSVLSDSGDSCFRRHAGQTDVADYRADLPGGTLHVFVAAEGAMAPTGPAIITSTGTIRLADTGEAVG